MKQRKEVETNLKKIFPNKGVILLAYDQGLEHGPTDFNDVNVDPSYIIEIAKKGKADALVFHKGIAEKYKREIKKSKVPLILKLNGKTNLSKGEPVSRQLCSVKEAIDLGATGVGYTIYIGSEHESIMMDEFTKIVEEAHKKGLPVILWAYPRGKGIKNKSKRELMAYSARVGLELGADMVKIIPSGKKQDLEWSVKSAGKTKVVIAGGSKKKEKEFFKEIQEASETGIFGLAIGRNVWQDKDPIFILKNIRKKLQK